MASTVQTDIRDAAIDLSEWDVSLDGPLAEQPADLTAKVAALLTGAPGFAVAYGSSGVLARHGLEVRSDRHKAYELLESVFRGAMDQIDFARFAVVDRPMKLAQMDVDGFNLNQDFSHDNQVASRAFMTSKCIHFDAATPFIANIYGPTDNIEGGHPVLSDVRSYCRDHGVEPSEVVDAIPNNYNVVVRKEHYEKIRSDYSAALEIDIETDIIIIMLLNEIAYGLAHGATPPAKRDSTKPARRPLRHFEYQFSDDQDYVTWYDHYRIPMVTAHDYAGENLSLDYYGPAQREFHRLVKIGSKVA
jgi:hypothetical protein